MTAYAIARVAKVKSLGSLRGLGAHHMRTAPTPNANPNAPETVRVLVGSGDPAQDVQAALPDKVRKNGVLAMEHLLTASPEYFRPGDPGKAGTYDKARMEAWAAKALQFLKDRYGDNLASAVLHLDEATPHIQALVVPKRPDGKLDAAKLFTPVTLQQLQDGYAHAMAPLGLSRGIEGSRAKHEPVKRFYGVVDAPVPEVKTPPPPKVEPPTLGQRLAEVVGLKTEHSKAAKAAEAQQAKRSKEVKARNSAALEKAKAVELRQKADASRDKAVEAMKAEARRVREIPLPPVLEKLGCTPDPKDKKNWRTPAGRMTVDGAKFYCHDDAAVKGGGAIDLVMKLTGEDFKGAVAWLGGNIDREAAIGAAMARAREEAKEALQATKPRALIPDPKPEQLPRVRRYLEEVRKIPARLVGEAIEAGRLWADRFGNCVFALKGDGGATVGAELRGTQDEPFHGIRGQKGLFALPGKGRAVFVESAIDALSYRALDRTGAAVLSTGGSSRERMLEWAAQLIGKGFQIVAGFDNDAAGQRQAEALADELRRVGHGCEREAPPEGCKDWNDALRAKSEGGGQPPAAPPTSTRSNDLVEQMTRRPKGPR